MICAIVGLSTLAWIWMAIGHFGGFAWGLFGFEGVVLLGSVMSVLVCLSKVRVGMNFPLAIACFVGTILVAMVFGLYVDARALVGDNPTIGPWINRTMMLRLGAIVLLSTIASLDVYRRDARSWGLVLRAGIFLSPIVVLGVWIKLKGIPSALDPAGELSPLRMIVTLVAGLVILILFSIGGHFLIRSFEIALPEPDPDHSARKAV